MSVNGYGKTPQQRPLLIPVKNSDQAVEVFTDELPEDVNDIIDILRAEVAPLDVWLQFAVEYYNQHQIDKFQDILSVASEPGIEKIYEDAASRAARVKFFNALAGHAVSLMWHEDDEKKKEVLAQRAVGYFQRADRLNPSHPMTLVGKALMFMAKNEDDSADRFLKSALLSETKNLPAVLAKGLLLYRRQKYGEAKKMYLQAIQMHPYSPQASRMRMCFAYCCYREGSVDKARAVMQNAAALDDTNVDAVIANALWQLALLSRTERARNVRDESSRFMMLIHHAHAIDRTNPTVLNHLANHYFAQWVPLSCTVSVTQGSCNVATSRDISTEVSPGQIICIGDRYVAYISRHHPQAVTSTGFVLDGVYRDPTNPSLNVARKDYDKMLTLAGNAFHSTKVPEIRSESCYLMGRACHAQGNYGDAYSYYFNAVRLWPAFVLPWFGLAQMYLERKEYLKASLYLEKAIALYPENVEVLLLLGNVYGKLEGKTNEAVGLFRRVVEIEPGNVDALLGTAELLHGSSDRKELIIAISSYVAAEKVMRASSEPIPMEFYVNLGALQHRVGKLKDAIISFKKALHHESNKVEEEKSEDVEGYGDDDLSELPYPNEKNVTILYNIARAYEGDGELGLAKKLYESILKCFPKYIDCILRQGCMLRDEGKTPQALEKFQSAIKIDPTCAEAFLLQANIHMKKKEWSYAQKKFESVMGIPNLKNDPYAYISMGNVYMSNLGEKNRYSKNMSLGEVYYTRVLSANKRNIYAANGLGILVSEKGNFEAAKQIFTQVREAAPEMPDAWINLAHILMAEERYPEAIQMYSVCLTKCYGGRDLEVLLYLAKAYYESKNYPKCISTLSRTIHLYPNDLRLWYNIGLAQEDFAVMTLGQTDSTTKSADGTVKAVRTLADVQRAIQDLERARRIFQFLLKHTETQHNERTKEGKKGSSLPFEKEKVSDHEKFCGDTLTKASYHLEFERQKEEKRRLENEKQRKMLSDYEAQVAKAKEEERIKEEEMKKHRADVLMKQEERLKALSEGWALREREESKKRETTGKKRGKKRKNMDDDDFIDENDEEMEDASDGEDSKPMSIEDMRNRGGKINNILERRAKRAKGEISDTDREKESENEGNDDHASGLFGSDSSDDENEPSKATSAPASPPSATQADDTQPAASENKTAEHNELFGSSSDSE